MDFDLDEAQRAIASSAAQVLAGPVRRGDLEAGQRQDEDGYPGEASWRALAKAGLTALTLPGRMGGDDLGVLEAAVLLTEAGRQAAAVPALATIMLGALPVVRWGSAGLQDLVLAGVGSGEVLLTAGVRERSAVMPSRPAALAVLPGPGEQGPGTVTGTKVGVPYAEQAAWILVPASVAGGGQAVVVVGARSDGVSLRPSPVSGAAPEYTVRLDAAPVAGVLGAGSARGEAVGDLYRLAVAGAAALADGLVAGALALTAGYIAGREQFGKPLATFQAVAGQAADVYIASRTLHLAALSACWRISAGLDAERDTDVAAYWLAAEAPTALRTCHQLHGGIGLDIGYPLHRYSAMISDLARFVGGAACRLDLLADREGQQCSSS